MLDHATYHTPANTAITSSKVITFAKSKDLYRRRFIEGIDRDLTPSMRVGRAVDQILAVGSHEEGLTKAEARDVDGLVAEIKRHPLWEELSGHEKQVIIEADGNGYHFAGIPDFLGEGGGKVLITDLKVSSAAKVESWYWNVMRMKYHVQAGCYRELVRRRTGVKKKDIVFRHIVAWKEDDLYRVRPFLFAPVLIDEGWKEFDKIAKMIVKEKEFVDPLFTWNDAIVLKRPQKRAEAME